MHEQMKLMRCGWAERRSVGSQQGLGRLKVRGCKETKQARSPEGKLGPTAQGEQSQREGLWWRAPLLCPQPSVSSAKT